LTAVSVMPVLNAPVENGLPTFVVSPHAFVFGQVALVPVADGLKRLYDRKLVPSVMRRCLFGAVPVELPPASSAMLALVPLVHRRSI
jgi:hypothetical protein